MPIATVSTEPQRHDLTTLDGGFVVLKEMTFGQKLRRQELATEQSMKGMGKGDDAEMAIKMASQAASTFEFKHCIVQHNLEEYITGNSGDTQLLDFNKPDAIQKLSSKVGDEIDALISAMNNFEEDEADGSGN